MKHKFFERLSAALLACIMIFGLALSPMAPVTVASAAEEFSAEFAEGYAVAGQPMTVNVTGSGDITYTWKVDGKEVGTGDSYTPTEEDLMKWISVTVKCGSDSKTLEMFFSKLPVVYINTENNAPIVSKEDYINAELIIQGNETYNSDTTTLYNGVTEIRGRGNSTWGQPKKPYKLKLDKKTDVFGMGKNKHWVLLANYLDESLLRNTLAYDLSGNMGMNQMSTVFVDVILNGDFIGNYQFCEQVRVDGTRVDVFDWESFCEDSAGVIADAEGLSKDLTGDLEEYMLENMGWVTSGTVKFNGVTYTIANYPDIEIPSINGGYLLELDEYYDEISKFKTADSQPIMFKNPEFVNTNADMMAFVKTYIQAFEDAVNADSYTAEYEGETLHYSELFDFQSLVDYWLINEIFFNEELNKKSTYMYKEIDELVHMGPIWDMDWSSGGEGQTYHTEQWATRYYSTNAQSKSWYKALIQDPYFIIRAQERYWAIRNDQVADMMEQIDSSYELLKESAASNGKRWGYRSDYKKYVDDLRTWFTKHLSWLDVQMATQDSLRDSLGYHPSSRLTLELTDAKGNALEKDYAVHAPADALAADGQDLKLVITGGNDTTGNAVLYVNGRRTSVTEFTANSSVTVDVPAESLTAEDGAKNVLEVQIEKADGSINASRYITVIFGDHEHHYEAVVTAPTCTEGGYTTYTCACGDFYIADETAALGHTEEIIPGKAPTFDETGLTEGKKCSVCGVILVEQEVIPAIDFTARFIPLSVLEVSCGDYEKNGGASEGPAHLAVDENPNTLWHTDWYGTSRENHWFQFEITEDYAVDGLCYQPRQTGNSNGTITKYDIQVSEDGENFRSVATGEWENNRSWKVALFDAENVKFVRLYALDAATDNAYVFASAAEIRLTGEKAAAHEHTPTEAVKENEKAATCTDPGSYDLVVYCSECNEELSRETVTVDALGHTAAEPVYENQVAATCTTAGSYDSVIYCSVCNAELARETVTINALGHIETTVPGKEATCTEPGLTEGKKCAVCGETLVAQEEIPALGHTEEVIPGKEATCTEPGLTEGKKCAVCGEILVAQEEIPALGHTEEIIPGKEATCTETGLTEGKKCAVCDEILVAQEVIPALGHDWDGTSCKNCDEKRENPFVDVDEVVHKSFLNAILWASEEGITTGTDASHFNPSGTCMRGHVVTFLWRAMGEPEPTITENPFVDVDASAYYYKAVLWAYEKGITTGIDATHFNPTGKCNRAQVVTFLWRAVGKPGSNATESGFTDVTNTQEFYYDAVLWAVENGITNGMGDGTFGVLKTCNRAQVVTFLYRTFA